MTANQIRRALPAAPRRHWKTVLAAVGLGMLALNLLTPLAADDYFFACRLIVRPDGMLFPGRAAADGGGSGILPQKLLCGARRPPAGTFSGGTVHPAARLGL